MRYAAPLLLALATACELPADAKDTAASATDPTGQTTGGTDPGDGDIAACYGDFVGVYTGTDSGTLAGEMVAPGDILVTFVSDGSGTAIEGVIAVDPSTGDALGGGQGADVWGQCDLSACSCDGEWEFLGGVDFGVWSMAGA